MSSSSDWKSGRMGTPDLREKRNQWLTALSGEDCHAILNQLTLMSWNCASFRVVNEARGLAPPAPDGGVQVNGLMHLLINRLFFDNQIISIRRLMDPSPLEGKRSVYSLASLLNEIQENRHLLTRGAIFAAEGLVYDYEPIRQRALEYVKERTAAGETAFLMPEDLAWDRHEDRHVQIDALAGASPENRRPCDIISEKVFTNLLRRAEKASGKIADRASKFVAHPATPESRALVKADVTLKQLWEAHQCLCEVAGFLAIYVLGGSCGPFLPNPTFDQFLYIDKPLVESSQVAQLQQIWIDFDKDCREWSQWGLNAYAKEFGG